MLGLALVLTPACESLSSQQPAPFEAPMASPADLRELFSALAPRDWEACCAQLSIAALAATSPGLVAVVRSLLGDPASDFLVRGLALNSLRFVQTRAALNLLLETSSQARGSDPLDALHGLTNKPYRSLAPLWRSTIARERAGTGTMVLEYGILGLGLTGDSTDLPVLRQLAREGRTPNVRWMAETAARRIEDPSLRLAYWRETFAQPDTLAERFVPAPGFAQGMARDLCLTGGRPRFSVALVASWCQWAARSGHGPGR